MKNFPLTKIVNKVKSDRFLTNSTIFFMGSFLASFGNYVFHFLMARMLSVGGYGELQSLIAVSAVFGIPIAALTTVLVQRTAHFKAREQQNKIYSLFLLFTRKILIIAGSFLAIFFLLNKLIANFLNLATGLPVIILGIGFLPGFLSSVNRGIIQGLQKFKSASIISIVEISFKVLLAVLLVKAGLAINGVMGAIVLAALIGYFIALLPLRFLLKNKSSFASVFVRILKGKKASGDKEEKINTKETFRFFFPVLFTVLFLSLLFNIDVILVKHFMLAHTAGEYGALALIGHIIIFLGGPIMGVMFPMSAAAHSNNKNPTKVFKKTIFLVSLMGLGTLFFYFLFPNFVIKILVGSKFLAINKFLGWFGVSMFFYSLIHLFSLYFLSIRKTKCFYLLGVGVLLQVILISSWHNNLWQIVWIMNGVMFVTLTLLAIYYKRTKGDYA